MNNIIDGAKVAVGCVVLGVAAVPAIAVAPIVSLVAVLYFAAKVLPKWIEHRSLYERTLTDQTREKHGRIPGQDYTRWDGKAVKKVKETEADRIHARAGYYPHGAKMEPTFSGSDCPIKTKEDAEWLTREYTRRETEERLEPDLRLLRVFAKALIPVLGIIWVLLTEIGLQEPGQLGCRVCRMGNDADDTHWTWRAAIQFHQKNIRPLS